MGPRTRALKPIGNLYIRSQLNKLPVGLDGELIAMTEGKVDFRKTHSVVRRADGEPEFKYVVFDSMRQEKWSFQQRYTIHCKAALENAPDWLELAPQKLLHTPEGVEHFYKECLAQGFEGIIMRTVPSPYKHGRSTMREQFLMRMKPLETAEGVVVAVEEEMENLNAARENELGYSHRSSAMAGKFGKGRMGSLVVKSPKWKKNFRLGTGFDHTQRRELFVRKPIGAVVEFEYDPSGGYDQPRQPRFKGFRNPADLVGKV
jgi:ATP-dependent DNA ligase